MIVVRSFLTIFFSFPLYQFYQVFLCQLSTVFRGINEREVELIPSEFRKEERERERKREGMEFWANWGWPETHGRHFWSDKVSWGVDSYLSYYR